MKNKMKNKIKKTEKGITKIECKEGKWKKQKIFCVFSLQKAMNVEWKKINGKNCF